MAYRRTPQVQARLDAQRAAILDATGNLLAEHGLRGCSVTAVATAAGIASGTVYNHFESKGELLAAVFRHNVQREVEAVRTAVASRGSAADRMSAVIETFAGRALKQPRLAYALLAEPSEPVVEKLRLEYHREFRDVVAAAIDEGVRTGELPAQNALVVATALVGAIDHALVAPLTDGADDTVSCLITFAFRALGVRHADA